MEGSALWESGFYPDAGLNGRPTLGKDFIFMGKPAIFDLLFFLLFYSFLGWVTEAAYYAVTQRRFCNRGITSMPFILSYGVTFVLLILVLPTIGKKYLFSFLITMATVAVVESLSDQITRRIGARVQWEPERSRLFSGNKRGFLFSVVIAAVYTIIYYFLHPMVLALVRLLPELLVKLSVSALCGLLVLDFASVLYALRTGDARRCKGWQAKSSQTAFGTRLSRAIWRRLHKAYPSIRDAGEEEEHACIFAQGLCLDKLIWVFLVSSVLGDVIETLYCGIVDGRWMNRSSVLYGPFSFVWGWARCC